MDVLSSLLSKSFSQQVRFRGQALFSIGRVEIVTDTAWDVVARAEGTARYTVSLHREGDELQASCSCPYYQDHGPCKHIWATILQADAKELLRGPSGNGRLKLSEMMPIEEEDEDEFGDDLDEDDDEIDEAEEGEFRLTSPPLSPATGAKKQAAAPPPPPVWKRKLGSLTAPRYEEPVERWPADRRLLYLVNLSATANGDALVLELLTQDKKLNGEWAKPRPVRIPLGLIRHLSDAEDRAILAAILGGRSQYEYGRTQVDSVQQLNEPLCDALLPRLCATGRFGLRAPTGDAWAPLSWDDGEPWEPAFQIRRGNNGWMFEGYFRRGDQTMALNQHRRGGTR
jgi:hypothetical protein